MTPQQFLDGRAEALCYARRWWVAIWRGDHIPTKVYKQMVEDLDEYLLEHPELNLEPLWPVTLAMR